MTEGKVVRLEDVERDQPWQTVSAMPVDEFLDREMPPRETMLSPWLPQSGLAMLHAPRGLGKTQLAVGVAWAVATGTGFLKWEAKAPARVLLLDGEMPASDLQNRFRTVQEASEFSVADPDYLRIAASDLMEFGLPDLSEPRNQPLYEDVIADADLIIVDNLSTLCPGVKENDADSWVPVQRWALAKVSQSETSLIEPG